VGKIVVIGSWIKDAALEKVERVRPAVKMGDEAAGADNFSDFTIKEF
jgi:hypothetical protein